MKTTWQITPHDDDAAAELADFLPECLFDAHAHLYCREHMPTPPALTASGPAVVSSREWRESLGRIVGAQRLAGALFIPYPHPDAQTDVINAFLVEQLDAAPESCGLLVVEPSLDRRDVERQLAHPRVRGFKPYHVYSAEKPTFQSSLGGYLPEWAWELAHERGLIITLHLVRDRALADEDNQREIRAACLKYPNARLVLAHAARGFHAPNTVKGLAALANLPNLWFDSSAICEAEALTAILDQFGPRKLMWGSDFPVSQQRGRCVTVGDQFAWICPERIDTHLAAPGCRPTLVGIESLRALREAARQFGLNADDLRDIFHNNAVRLLGLLKEPERTQSLYQRARTIIPGGVQLLSKRPEMLAPGQWPAYFREARGCEVWDLDGRRYYDLSTNGIGSCLLGFRDPDVTRAVVRRVRLGSMSSLNPPEEVELAERLCAIHPWAERARFARCGGEIAAVAVRIARATTGRSAVAICGYHGWQDWYLAANLGENDSLRGHLLPGLEPSGVPSELRGTAHTFTYNNREELQRVMDAHGPRLAAVIMEPCRYHDPAPGFLQAVRDAATRAGAMLIFDEITIGWRKRLGGGHLDLGVNPDMAIFAKALGNGHPIAAVLGTRAAMEGAESSFISSTYWTESVGPAAALAALEKFGRVDVAGHVARVGTAIQSLWRTHAAAHGLPVAVDDGYPCLAHFAFTHPEANTLRTLYAQLMLERGFLAGTAVYPTFAHTEEVVARYGRAIDEVFGELARMLASGDLARHLKGPVAHTGFRRLL